MVHKEKNSYTLTSYPSHFSISLVVGSYWTIVFVKRLYSFLHTWYLWINFTSFWPTKLRIESISQSLINSKVYWVLVTYLWVFFPSSDLLKTENVVNGLPPEISPSTYCLPNDLTLYSPVSSPTCTVYLSLFPLVLHIFFQCHLPLV